MTAASDLTAADLALTPKSLFVDKDGKWVLALGGADLVRHVPLGKRAHLTPEEAVTKVADLGFAPPTPTDVWGGTP